MLLLYLHPSEQKKKTQTFCMHAQIFSPQLGECVRLPLSRKDCSDKPVHFPQVPWSCCLGGGVVFGQNADTNLDLGEIKGVCVFVSVCLSIMYPL